MMLWTHAYGVVFNIHINWNISFDIIEYCKSHFKSIKVLFSLQCHMTYLSFQNNTWCTEKYLVYRKILGVVRIWVFCLVSKLLHLKSSQTIIKYIISIRRCCLESQSNPFCNNVHLQFPAKCSSWRNVKKKKKYEQKLNYVMLTLRFPYMCRTRTMLAAEWCKAIGSFSKYQGFRTIFYVQYVLVQVRTSISSTTERVRS